MRIQSSENILPQVGFSIENYAEQTGIITSTDSNGEFTYLCETGDRTGSYRLWKNGEYFILNLEIIENINKPIKKTRLRFKV